MKKITVFWTGGLIVVLVGLAFLFSGSPPAATVSAQQDRGWKVFVKTSPCSGRFDWVTVAKENPTGQGGSNYWESADLIAGNTVPCVSNGDNTCTKAEAEASAAVVRASPRFTDYCCKEYSVWQNPQTGAFKIVVGKFATAPAPFMFEDGPMCCEEAEAITGITNACGTGGTTHTTGVSGFGPTTNSSIDGKTLTFYQGTTPERCQADCAANTQCKAFGLVKAGFYNPGDPAMCYLLSEVTAQNPHACCISAVKVGSKPGGQRDGNVGAVDNRRICERLPQEIRSQFGTSTGKLVDEAAQGYYGPSCYGTLNSGQQNYLRFTVQRPTAQYPPKESVQISLRNGAAQPVAGLGELSAEEEYSGERIVYLIRIAQGPYFVSVEGMPSNKASVMKLARQLDAAIKTWGR